MNKTFTLIKILFVLILIPFKVKAQDRNTINLGIISHIPSHFSSSIKPYLGFTFNDKYEIGMSYTQSRSTYKEDFYPLITLNDKQSYFGFFSKIYLRDKKDITFQIGYNRLSEDLDKYLLITSEKPVYDVYGEITDYVTGNHFDKRTLSTYTSWISISCGYSIKIISKLFIEPQISYLFVWEKGEKHDKNIKDYNYPYTYPDNIYKIINTAPEYSSEIQMNIMLTYKI